MLSPEGYALQEKIVDYVMAFLEENGLRGLFNREAVVVTPLWNTRDWQVVVLDTFNYPISGEVEQRLRNKLRRISARELCGYELK